MPQMMRAEFEGLSGCKEAFAELAAQAQGRLMRSVVGAGAKVVRDEAIARAPKSDEDKGAKRPPSGTLRRAIYMAWSQEASTEQRTSFVVAVRKGGKRAKAGTAANASKFGPVNPKSLDAYYWAWVEFGHYTHASKSAGATVRARRKAVEAGTVSGAYFVMPRPFLRPALETKREAALVAMAEKFKQRLPEMVEKARRKAGRK